MVKHHTILSHVSIINRAGGYKALADTVGLPRDEVRHWLRRKSIPPGRWTLVAGHGVATLEELATAAAEVREHSKTLQKADVIA